ncbi:MAG TPA: ferritin-like domain-containing protein, partial [Anaeromyxobacteraceae bacterium]|nr:ferritin-like domain-containing protein [Anaeromyxobacteraceae bacterium]
MAKGHSTKPTDVGLNRTGSQLAPQRAKEMLEGAAQTRPVGSPGEFARFRAELAAQAPPVGTVPPPGTVKGMAKTAMKALQGEKASVFVDKLAARLAFERTGVRLYDALLAKIPAGKTSEGTLTVEAVRQIRDEELAHFHLCREAIESLGADPTAMTPCADLSGVEGTGLVQVLTDPRFTITQCVDALLIAELADNDSWKILIAMAEALGQDDLARRFTDALATEDR